MLTTLVMTALIAIWILSLLQMVLLLQRANQQLVQQHQAFYRLESQADQLLYLTSVQRWQKCLSRSQDLSQMIAQLDQDGCRLMAGGDVYRYLITDLGVMPCLQIVTGDQLQASHHWVLTMANQDGMGLQWRVATPEKNVLCSDFGMSLQIQAGILSWRYLDLGNNM